MPGAPASPALFAPLALGDGLRSGAIYPKESRVKLAHVAAVCTATVVLAGSGYIAGAQTAPTSQGDAMSAVNNAQAALAQLKQFVNENPDAVPPVVPGSTTTVKPTTTVGATTTVKATTTTGATTTTTVVTPPVQSAAGCGLAAAAFCDTFSAATPGATPRGGDLSAAWGVSRTGGASNLGQGQFAQWAPTALELCGSTVTVSAPRDVQICNGQLHEAMDDQHGVQSLAMYPKQPFDFAGRTGKVTFDVRNDTQGSHAAWPEFWMSDKPVPAPFTHEGSFAAIPANGFGLRFAGCTDGERDQVDVFARSGHSNRRGIGRGRS